MFGFFMAVAIMSAFMLGYGKAHYDVANECKKLGRFYVDNEVFECVKITTEGKEEN